MEELNAVTRGLKAGGRAQRNALRSVSSVRMDHSPMLEALGQLLWEVPGGWLEWSIWGISWRWLVCSALLCGALAAFQTAHPFLGFFAALGGMWFLFLAWADEQG